ncbi:DUF155-domain-containing protein [Exidia glandulosa HHB12029]|uniref:DUF155-domain-containing protein n=1 Tax=Exidia glandulosa HHB12029 TaxID=1314781 RepID=A0A166A6P2_EXIGL|nr:DUF155-domain-containing protein [Exidia glandulosa HHB12029]
MSASLIRAFVFGRPSSSRVLCRSAGLRLASTLAEVPGPSPKQSKTTTNATLRKKAAASLPIRSHPSPTRSSIRSVLTLTTAERLVLPALARSLPPTAVIFEDAYWVPKWRAGEGDGAEVFLFDNGSIVGWGMDSWDELERFVGEVMRPGVEVGRLVEWEREELEFVTDPHESTRLQGDLIILGTQPALDDPDALPHPPPSGAALPASTFAARYAFSQALARSTALSALESSLETYLSSVATLPQTLALTGKPGLSRRQLIVKIGELLKFRQSLNLKRETFGDTPDFYWTEPVLEEYFKALSNALEMRQRIAALNSKITYASETQTTLREMLAESSGHRMELVIIALISVEVVFVLIHNGPDLWNMITGKEVDVDNDKKRH